MFWGCRNLTLESVGLSGWLASISIEEYDGRDETRLDCSWVGDVTFQSKFPVCFDAQGQGVISWFLWDEKKERKQESKKAKKKIRRWLGSYICCVLTDLTYINVCRHERDKEWIHTST